jgi:C1A family cysteine protease
MGGKMKQKKRCNIKKTLIPVCMLITLFCSTNSFVYGSQVSPITDEEDSPPIEVPQMELAAAVDEKAAEPEVAEPELRLEWKDEYVMPSVQTGSQKKTKAVAVPSQYDARESGVVTPVVDQGYYQICWAIAAAYMGESSLLSKGSRIGNPISAETLNLSERHLSYFFANTPVDPLSNTTGDYNQLQDYGGSTNYLWVGGNPIFTTFSLANWVGLAEEKTAPWSEIMENGETGMELNSDLGYQDAAHLQNAYWISTKDIDHIKKAIMEYGGAILPMNYEYQYFNSATNSFYRKTATADNHSVVLVGWNDHLAATAFGDDPNNRPSTDGAFLVKNTFGEAWGDQGYFWISYEDYALTKDVGGAVYIYDFVQSDNYDNNYQYDGSAGRYIGESGDKYINKISSGGSISNIFHVPEDAKASQQALRSVSFSTLNTNLNYQIQIYKNPKTYGDPRSGMPLLKTPQTGSTLYTGYYTIPLAEDCLLERGDSFAVVVTLSSQDNKDIIYCADYSYENGGWIRFVSATKPGQSYVLDGTWKDLHQFGAAARIKAFTDDIFHSYTIDAKVANDKGGTVSGSGEFQENKVVVLTAMAEEGYKFVNWMEEGVIVSDKSELSFAVKENRSLQAVFQKDEETKNSVIKENQETPSAITPTILNKTEKVTTLVQQNNVDSVRSKVYQTGDNNHTNIWLFLFGGSGIVLIGFILILSRQKHQKKE